MLLLTAEGNNCYNRFRQRPLIYRIFVNKYGRVAQLVRAVRSHRTGPWFESRHDHWKRKNNMKLINLEKLKIEPAANNSKIKKKVYLEKDKIPGLQYLSEFQLKTGQLLTEKSHSDIFKIIKVEDGQGIIKIEGKVTKINQGDCIIIEPGDPHEFLNTGAQDLILLCLALKK